jgi:hypothetical protein
MYVDTIPAKFGSLARLSFESGAMFLDGNVVMMNLPKARNANTGYFLNADSVTRAEYSRYVSSGYELGESELSHARDGTPILLDPILFYSQNSHRICTHTLTSETTGYLSSAFKGHKKLDSSPVLLLFPDFPWLEGCPRVKLMKTHDPDVTKDEFSPTSLYETRLRTKQSPYAVHLLLPPADNTVVDFGLSHMYFTVVCGADDRCGCDGCAITLTTVRKLIGDPPLVLTLLGWMSHDYTRKIRYTIHSINY